MRFYAVVDLGANYSLGGPEFWGTSLAACLVTFRDYLMGYNPQGDLCPCVDQANSEAYLFTSEQAANEDLNNAFARIFVGPRGGIRLERC